MKLGVISDTHAFFDPALQGLMAGVDAILHAAGCQPEDLEIGRADLENVFLEIMQGETKPLPLKAAVAA